MTRVQPVRYTKDTRVTRVKNFDFDNGTGKNIFSHHYFTIWQVNDYKERHKFILRTTFWKCFDPMPKWVRKLHDKN